MTRVGAPFVATESIFDGVAGTSPGILLLLVSLSLIGGIIAGMGGPGGILVIVPLFSIAALPPSLVAGTSITIFVAALLVATATYAFSGDVDWRMALLLGVTAIVATPIGVWANGFLSDTTFRGVLAALLLLLGANLVYREVYGLAPAVRIDVRSRRGRGIVALVGLAVGVISGATGFGGSGLAAPILVVLGVPTLVAIGSAVVFGLFVTVTSSTNYLLRGSVDPVLVVVLGIPFVTGIVTGWGIAHRIDVERLNTVLGAIVLAVGFYVLVP